MTMPTHYHVSCRVRNSMAGLDAETNEHADTVIETQGTPILAFTIWATTKGSWIHATAGTVEDLLSAVEANQDESWGLDWSSTYSLFAANDWDVGEWEHDVKNHKLFISGTACCSEFEYEITIEPVL